MKPYAIYALLFCGLYLLPACKKSTNNPTPAAATPSVTSIAPLLGPKNTLVTITGSNFGTDPTKVTVTFNAVAATVQSVSNTQITALVPAKAGTGKVTVTINAQAADGAIFTYTPSYTVSTVAGNGLNGVVDGAGNIAEFSSAAGIVVDAQGNLFLADQLNNRIRKIVPGNPATVSTFAGSTNTNSAHADGIGTAARFAFPTALILDAQGNMIETDISGTLSLIRKITPAAAVSTLTGLANGQGSGYTDGSLSVAQFYGPCGVALDAQGNMYVADFNNKCIRKVTTAGVVSTLAGNVNGGYAEGTGTAASFRSPYGVAADAQGNIFVADCDNRSIRKVTQAGVVTTYCGGGPNVGGTTDGDISVARFSVPRALAFDSQGNLYVTDIGNHRIRKITAAGVVSTVAGSTQGYTDGDGATAQFNYPNGIVVDGQGNIYVTDANNYRIRKITQE